MIRLLFYISLIALEALLVIFIWSYEGLTIIELGEWRVTLQTRIGMFLIVIVAFAVFFLGMGISTVRKSLVYNQRLRKSERRIRDLRSLIYGFSLFTAGLKDKAQAKCVHLSKKSPDYLLGATFSAALKSDDAKISGLEEALEDVDLMPFALSELIKEPKINTDAEVYPELLQLAATVASDAPWFRKAQYVFALEHNNWEVAASMVEGEDGEAKQHRARLLVESGRLALQGGDADKALNAAKSACSYASSWSPSLALHVEVLIHLGKHRQAFTLLQDYWRRGAHPDFIDVFTSLTAHEKPDVILKKARKLIKNDPDGYAARLLLGVVLSSAMESREAIDVLKTLYYQTPTEPVYNYLMKVSAHLDEQNFDVFQREAPPMRQQAVWKCHSCQVTVKRWAYLCEVCGKRETIDWVPASIAEE